MILKSTTTLGLKGLEHVVRLVTPFINIIAYGTNSGRLLDQQFHTQILQLYSSGAVQTTRNVAIMLLNNLCGVEVIASIQLPCTGWRDELMRSC